MFDVKWTGEYPSLCYGEWKIKYNGLLLLLPENIKDKPMNTAGTYRRWYFDDNWSEVFEDYEDGLGEEEWIEKNACWLKPLFEQYSIPFTSELLAELFSKIQAEDFRSGSCGGCI